jgi:cellobiose epimerase
LMEAWTAYFALTKTDLVRARLEELISIQRDRVFRPEYGSTADRHLRDWSPVKGRWNRSDYGHDLENVWLIADACDAIGASGDSAAQNCGRMFASSLREGFDRKRGGFYLSGPFGGPAIRRQKVWWVQAEALVAALAMFKRTGNPQHSDCYLKTLDWIVSTQIDWQHGEWHAEIAPNGRPLGDKAGPWKCCYHNGRAMLRCLALLDDGARAVVQLSGT